MRSRRTSFPLRAISARTDIQTQALENNHSKLLPALFAATAAVGCLSCRAAQKILSHCSPRLDQATPPAYTRCDSVPLRLHNAKPCAAMRAVDPGSNQAELRLHWNLRGSNIRALVEILCSPTTA